MLKGACNCGTVAFEIQADTKDIYMCHCSICRRASGVQGMAVLVVPKADFKWIQGESGIHTWKKPDGDWQCWFCPTCGSHLPGNNDDQRMYVPVGLVTEGVELLQVSHHIYTGSKAPWYEISDTGKHHKCAFQGG